MLANTIYKGFDPIIFLDTEILLIGTFPGISSIDANQYYFDSRNLFWKLIFKISQTEKVPDDYHEKINLLKKLKIGIWDVFSEAERKNPTSLDSDLIGITVNDFESFLNINKSIKIIAFNGQLPEKLFKKHIQLSKKDNLEFITLPSSSNVNTRMTFERKCEEWKKVFKSLNLFI